MTLKRMIQLLKEYLRMDNLESTDTTGASVNNYRLNQIDEIKDYFNNEITKRKASYINSTTRNNTKP